MNPNSSLAKIIAARVKTIRQKINGGSLYGKLVDINDTNMLILAAYELGKAEEREERARTWALLKV